MEEVHAPVFKIEKFLDQLPRCLEKARGGQRPLAVTVVTYRTIAGYPASVHDERVRPSLTGDTLALRIGGCDGVESGFGDLPSASQEKMLKRIYGINPRYEVLPRLIVAYGGNDHALRIWQHLALCAISHPIVFVVCPCFTGRMARGEIELPLAMSAATLSIVEGPCPGDYALGQIVQALSAHFQIPFVPEERS